MTLYTLKISPQHTSGGTQSVGYDSKIVNDRTEADLTASIIPCTSFQRNLQTVQRQIEKRVRLSDRYKSDALSRERKAQ
jgi:hypothetical protein